MRGVPIARSQAKMPLQGTRKLTRQVRSPAIAQKGDNANDNQVNPIVSRLNLYPVQVSSTCKGSSWYKRGTRTRAEKTNPLVADNPFHSSQ
jgi:hypothetical protein